MRRYLPILLILILFSAFSACEKKEEGGTGGNSPSAAGDKLKIGEYGSLTGANADFGQSTKRGIELAQEEQNKAGGLLGKQVEVMVEDTRSTPQEATSAVQKLIERDKAVAILGEVASTNSIAGGTVCQEKGIPMISPASTNPKVTEVGNQVFRICYLDDFQGEVVARFAAKSMNFKKVAILHDNSNDYSLGLTKFFTEAFKKYGGEILADEAYQTTDPDFSAQLTKIATLKPDAIFVPGYYSQVGQIAQQARKAGITVPLLGGDGWDSPSLIDLGKDALNGCYFATHYTAEDPDPDIQKFVSSYKAKYNLVPDAMAALGYDAAHIMFDAIKKANSADSKAIRDAIGQTKDFKGVTGSISINDKRNAVKPIVIVEIVAGKCKLKETIKPEGAAAAPATPAAK